MITIPTNNTGRVLQEIARLGDVGHVEVRFYPKAPESRAFQVYITRSSEQDGFYWGMAPTFQGAVNCLVENVLFGRMAEYVDESYTMDAPDGYDYYEDAA